MERNVNRDRHVVPELDSLLRVSADARLDAAAAAYAVIGGAALRPMVRIALDFGSWALLSDEGLTDPEIAAMMRRAVAGVASSPPVRGRMSSLCQSRREGRHPLEGSCLRPLWAS